MTIRKNAVLKTNLNIPNFVVCPLVDKFFFFPAWLTTIVAFHLVVDIYHRNLKHKKLTFLKISQASFPVLNKEPTRVQQNMWSHRFTLIFFQFFFSRFPCINFRNFDENCKLSHKFHPITLCEKRKTRRKTK